MKIDKNSSAFPFVYKDKYGDDIAYTGIPLRLEIASRIMAAVYSNPSSDMNPSLRNITLDCLDAADQLIEQHNLTCEGE